MSLRSTLLIAAVLAGLALAWTWHGAEVPVSPAVSPAAPAASWPVALPSPPAGSAPVIASPLLLPPAAASRPARSAALHVGSEGYGPHIERAQAGNDPAAAWEAVRWLQLCMSNDARRDSYERARAVGVVPEVMTQLMQEADEEGRRCQTVTAQHQALLPSLAMQAMQARISGAAATYAAAVSPGTLTADQRRDVAEAVRRDALGGSPSLISAAQLDPAWGLSDEERLSYLYVYAELFDKVLGAKVTVEALVRQGQIPFTAPPTPAQMAAAKLAGQRIVDRLRANALP